MGIVPTGEAQSFLLGGHGWQLRIGARPALYVSLMIPCATWKVGEMALRLLQQVDLRISPLGNIQVLFQEEHIVVLRILDEPYADAKDLRRAVESLIQWVSMAVGHDG
ncbi:hypothetical protein [Variovorax saccharolyticus]|uniref:hypothetical protein n=1 Tax=Variovorax saccharolyticus TaxID=3053516 RepID=UPI002575E953|nr:hypothetical protein [Variovorax sp. J31P216]MDM0030157.1 hypothetical protein [Variovorax sp. J31P216]